MGGGRNDWTANAEKSKRANSTSIRRSLKCQTQKYRAPFYRSQTGST